MRFTNPIGKENRLIYRKLSDFNDQTRYNSRNADLNAAQQASQYQAQLSLNQSTGQRTGDPNFQTAAKVPVSQELQNVRTVYNSPTGVTQNSTTGTVKPTLQFGQQVTDAMGSFQAPSLQGSNTSNPTPGQESNPSTPTGGTKDPTFYGQWGNEADMAAYEQRKTELLKQQQLKQQMDQASATKNAASSAASTAATQQNNQNTTDPLAKYDSMLAGLPPEDAASIRALLQSSFDSSDTQTGLAQKSYANEVKAADQSMNAYDAVLSQQRKDSKDLYNATQGFLDDTQERREEATAKAKENAIEQLKWEENRLVRQQKSANDKRLNQLVLGQAIGGGFGSSNWNAEVSEAEWEGEQAVLDLQKEFGFKRADVDIAFTEQLNGIYEFYGSQKLDALKTYKAELQNNSNLRFQATEKTESRKADARTKLNDTLATIAKDQAAEIKDATKEVRATIKELRAEELAAAERKRSDAFQFFNYAFTNSMDPALRQRAINMMTEAGYDLRGVDPSAPTPSVYLKALDQAKAAETARKFDPFQYDDPDSQSLMLGATTVGGSKVAQWYREGTVLPTVQQFIEQGQPEKAKDFLRGIARANLGDGQQASFAKRETVIAGIDKLLPDLEAIQNSGKSKKLFDGLRDAFSPIANKDVRDLTADDFDIYNKSLQKLRNNLGADSDPALKRVFAQIENVASIVINERYGAAVTDGEMDRAREFIAMSGNTLGDTIVKLQEYREITQTENDLLLDGGIGYVSRDPQASAPNSRTYDNNYYNTKFVPTEGPQAMSLPVTPSGTAGSIAVALGSKVTQDYNTPISSRSQGGIYDDSTVKAWGGKHVGLDIAMPEGTPLPAFVSGTVKFAKGAGGYGQSVVLVDDNGAEHRLSHLKNFASGLTEGQRVERGQVIGYSGNTGNSTGPHLDYRIFYNGKYIDPMTYKV